MNQRFGISLACGGDQGAHVLVTGFHTGGLARASGKLTKGCRILQVNGEDAVTANQVLAQLAAVEKSVVLSVSHEPVADVDLLAATAVEV